MSEASIVDMLHLSQCAVKKELGIDSAELTSADVAIALIEKMTAYVLKEGDVIQEQNLSGRKHKNALSTNTRKISKVKASASEKTIVTKRA